MKRKPRANRLTMESRHDPEALMKERLIDLLTTREAADILGIDESQVRRLAETKKIEAVKKGHAWIVLKSSLAEYLQAKSRRGRPPSGSE